MWVLTCMLCSYFLCSSAGNGTIQSLFTANFGDTSPNSIFTPGSTENITSMMLIVNSIQLPMSMMYISQNSILTSVALAQEWYSYGHSRQGLRTSSPHGAQRSTYWLSLPTQFALPSMLIFGFLHWLLSQGFFIVNVETYTALGPPLYIPWNGNSPTPFIITAGWSNLPLFLVWILESILLVIIWLLGRRRYHDKGMPFVGTCSLAISAACHPILNRRMEAL